jgi:hypothetical protein
MALFYSNKLEGPFPTLFNLPLVQLFLNDNAFSGTIPSTISQAAGLVKLSLAGTSTTAQFQGQLPDGIGALGNLT